MKELAVTFRNIDTDEYEGQGYHMPNEEVFNDYAVNELKAVKIDENKFRHPNRNSYVCLEESKI
jgi:hypothetical protein